LDGSALSTSNIVGGAKAQEWRKLMEHRIRQAKEQETKHDVDCDCGICQYCSGTEDVYGNSTAPIKIANLEAEIAHLREKLAAAEKLLREAVEPGVFGIQDRSRISAPEDEMIRELGLQIGFGALMDSASRMWAIVAEQDGHPGSEFVVSACATTQKKWVAQVEELLAIIDGKEETNA
jgi:hypothetical protein